MCLVTKEVDFREVLVFDVAQAVRLVPALGKDIEGELPSDGEREAIVREFLSQNLDEGFADAVFLDMYVSGGYPRTYNIVSYLIILKEVKPFFVAVHKL